MDDDYTSFGGSAGGSRGGGGGYTGYSAESHGTYDQPTLGHGNGRGGAESYVMRDVGGLTSTGAGYDSRYPVAAGGAGAAGIGAAVGVVAMQRARSRKDYANASGGAPGGSGGEYPQASPYPAFAGPAGAGGAPREMYDLSSGSGGGGAAGGSGGPGTRYRRATSGLGAGGGHAPDLLEAAGLLSSAAPVAASNSSPPGAYPNKNQRLSQQPPQLYTDPQGQGRRSDDLHPMQVTPTMPSRESYIGNGPYHVVYPLPPPNEQQSSYRSSSQLQLRQYQQSPQPQAESHGHPDDPFRRNTMPLPVVLPTPIPDAEMEDAYGGYADDDVGGGVRHHREGSDESRYSERVAGKGRMGEEGYGEERHEVRDSFQDEEDYGMQPRVLKVRC